MVILLKVLMFYHCRTVIVTIIAATLGIFFFNFLSYILNDFRTSCEISSCLKRSIKLTSHLPVQSSWKELKMAATLKATTTPDHLGLHKTKTHYVGFVSWTGGGKINREFSSDYGINESHESHAVKPIKSNLPWKSLRSPYAAVTAGTHLLLTLNERVNELAGWEGRGEKPQQ